MIIHGLTRKDAPISEHIRANPLPQIIKAQTFSHWLTRPGKVDTGIRGFKRSLISLGYPPSLVCQARDVHDARYRILRHNFVHTQHSSPFVKAIPAISLELPAKSSSCPASRYRVTSCRARTAHHPRHPATISEPAATWYPHEPRLSEHLSDESVLLMSFPGETGTLFPEAYLTKVPQRIQRREERLGKADNSDGSRLASELLDFPAKLIIHEDEVLYFDYGAVRLGRKPEPEDPDDPKPVCVGFGWLPGWSFTMSDRGLPDIVPAQNLEPKPRGESSGADEAAVGGGVLGLLYKLQLKGQQPAKGSLFQKKSVLDVKDLVYAGTKDWDATIHFHDKHKLLKQTGVYIHLFDGALGHKYLKDGRVVPFRSPGWPAKAVVHIDPGRGPQLIRTKEAQAVEPRLQGQWVAKELEKWVKDADLPQAYIDEVLSEWILADSGNQLKGAPSGGGSFKKFLGFSS